MSIMKMYTLPEDVYLTLIDAAGKHKEDIRSGVDEGIYDDTPENADEIAYIEAALNYQPTVDEVPEQKPIDLLNRHGKKIFKAVKQYTSDIWDQGNPHYRRALGEFSDKALVNVIFMHPKNLDSFMAVTDVPAKFPAEIANGIMHVINTGTQP